MNDASSVTRQSAEEGSASAPVVIIKELQPGDDATAFRTLNEEWISKYFTLEEKDRQQLNHPETILDHGGHIYLAYRDNVAVGCVALVPMPSTPDTGHVFELSKMAVAPHVRGLGIGRGLLLHVVDQARALGADSLFLGSNTRLVSAVALYESAGFRHLPPDRQPQLAYTRANVFMELGLRW